MTAFGLSRQATFDGRQLLLGAAEVGVLKPAAGGGAVDPLRTLNAAQRSVHTWLQKGDRERGNTGHGAATSRTAVSGSAIYITDCQ